MITKHEVNFSVDSVAELCSINKELGQLTGIDFCRKMIVLAGNDKKTERDAREFIKNNYPKRCHLSEKDNEKIELLIDLFLYWQECREIDEAPSYCDCLPKENNNEKPFRSRILQNFPLPEGQLEFVTGFFAKD